VTGVIAPGRRDPPTALWRSAGEELFAAAFGFLAFLFELRVDAVALFGGESGEVGVAGFVAIERGDFDGTQGDDARSANDADVLSGNGLFEAGAEVFFGFGDGEGFHGWVEEGQATMTPKKAPKSAPRHHVAVSGQPPEVHWPK
jgi:hypothetical protein